MLTEKRRNYGAIDSTGSHPVRSVSGVTNDSIVVVSSEEVVMTEKSSLLQRAVDEARSLGAKRFLVRSHSAAGGLERDEPELIVNEVLPDTQEDAGGSERRHEHITWSVRRKLKVMIMAAMTLGLTSVMIAYPEEVLISRIFQVSHGQPFILSLDQTFGNVESPPSRFLQVSLTGAFVPAEMKHQHTDRLVINATKVSENSKFVKSWELVVLRGHYEWSVVTRTFDLQEVINWETDNVTLMAFLPFGGSHTSVPLLLEAQFLSHCAGWGVTFGAVILSLMYLSILLEVAHRTVITMLAATASIAALALVDKRPTLAEIVTWIDVETLVLLFSMMIIVAILSETGVFNFIGYGAFRASGGKVWPLLGILCFVTAGSSAFLDNVTTILLMTPVIIQICEEIRVDPSKVLIANVIFSNIGGAMTAIGDPPNVLIVSDQDIRAKGVNFGSFSQHMIVCVVIIMVVSFFLLRLMYGKLDSVTDEIDELTHEIAVWSRTALSMPNVSRDEIIVRGAINLRIEELKEELEAKELRRQVPGEMLSGQPGQRFQDMCHLDDTWLLVKSVVVLLGTVTLFGLTNLPQVHLSLGWSALLGAITLLILADKLEVESILSKVEWSTLIFFATLFVVMEAVSKLGLLHSIGNVVKSIVVSAPEQHQLTVALVIILWVSGIASAFIDNIPYTAMMIPVVKTLSMSNPTVLPLQPLVWALSLGASLGGNGTLIGASANVVCAGIAEQHGHKFSFWDYFKVGFPITIASLIIATVYLWVCHVVIGWNGV